MSLVPHFQTEETFANDHSVIKIDATQADAQCPTGYFKIAMQEAWDKCKIIRGEIYSTFAKKVRH